MAKKIRARLELGPSAPAKARAVLRGLEGELPEPLFHDLRLLVSELVTNSYRHTEAGPDGAATLTVDVEPERVHVDVADPGNGFVPKPVSTSPLERSSGWGLALVDRIAERWGVTHDNGTHVWFDLGLRAG